MIELHGGCKKLWMISKIHSVVASLIMVLGIIHIGFAFPIEDFNTYMLYFIGSGVAIILIGLINLMGIKSPTSFNRKVCIFLNCTLMILSVVALLAVWELQVFIAIALFASSFILSLKIAPRITG